MRSALGKELRKQFKQAMSRTFPEFEEVKAPSVWPGARMYACRTPLASYFIRLVPHHDRDEFRIMFGWSASGEFPGEDLRRGAGDFGRDLPGDDGYEFRIMRRFKAGGAEDRWWVLENAMDTAFNRAEQEFSKPGDTPIQTLERTMSEGLSYIMSTYRETAVEKLLPGIPALIEDCMGCIRETVIPYFDKIKEFRSQNGA